MSGIARDEPGEITSTANGERAGDAQTDRLWRRIHRGSAFETSLSSEIVYRESGMKVDFKRG